MKHHVYTQQQYCGMDDRNRMVQMDDSGNTGSRAKEAWQAIEDAIRRFEGDFYTFI